METRRAPSQKRARRRASTTADILGAPAPRATKPAGKWQKHLEMLIKVREQILRRQEGLAKDAIQEQPTFSTHMADAGTDTYDRDLALGVLSAEQDAIYQIEQAIDRIRSGTYGICELTGKPIEPARLDAIPWTRFSAAAERKLEAEGKRKRQPQKQAQGKGRHFAASYQVTGQPNYGNYQQRQRA